MFFNTFDHFLQRLVETSEETEKKLRKDVSSYRSAYDKMARE